MLADVVQSSTGYKDMAFRYDLLVDRVASLCNLSTDSICKVRSDYS